MFAMFGLGPPELIVLGLFCLGGFAGILILIVVLATRSKPSMNSQLRPCPDCGNAVSKMATACPRCGRPIQQVG